MLMLKIFGVIAIVLGVLLAVPFFIWRVWMTILLPVFHVPALTFWQMFWILLAITSFAGLLKINVKINKD